MPSTLLHSGGTHPRFRALKPFAPRWKIRYGESMGISHHNRPEELADNWDGYGSPAPTTEVIVYAREALAMLHAGALAQSTAWTEPHISCNERGHVTLEWWKGSQTLTLYVRSANKLDYLKAWGSNIDSEMKNGSVEGIADFIALSRWLNP